MERAPLYRSDEPDVDMFNGNLADHRATPYELRPSGRTDIYSRNSVPRFLSDDEGEPDSGEYIAPPVRKRRRASISSKILAVVCAAAAAAILVALFSSDATYDTLVNVKASMAAVFPAPSAAAQPGPSHLSARNTQSAAAGPSATEDRTPEARSLTTAAVAAPAREEIRLAYQNAPRAAARGGRRGCARRHDARGNLRSRVSGEAGCSRLRAGPGHGAELVRESQSARIGGSASAARNARQQAAIACEPHDTLRLTNASQKQARSAEFRTRHSLHRTHYFTTARTQCAHHSKGQSYGPLQRDC
jgi:hypothetical protein